MASINIQCPSCESGFAIKDTLVGKKVDCPKCKYRFKAESADDDDDAPRSKKDKKARAKLEADESRIADEEKRLRDRFKSFESERDKLEEEKTALLERISKLTQTKGGLTIGQREELIAQREKAVAKREEALAVREKAVAQREKESGKTLQDLQQVLAGLQASGGATRTVIVNSPTPSSGASKTSVEKQQKNIKAKMAKKGLLIEDLPPTARELDNSARSATTNKDYDAATESYNNLEAMIDNTVINQAFVKGKFTRLERDVAGKGKGSDKKMASLLQEVSALFTEGRWDTANRKINQMYGLLEGNAE